MSVDRVLDSCLFMTQSQLRWGMRAVSSDVFRGTEQATGRIVGHVFACRAHKVKLSISVVGIVQVQAVAGIHAPQLDPSRHGIVNV